MATIKRELGSCPPPAQPSPRACRTHVGRDSSAPFLRRFRIPSTQRSSPSISALIDAGPGISARAAAAWSWARQPFRALRHRCLHCPAVLYRDIRDHCDMLSLHARSVAFHDSPKKNFLEAAFPTPPGDSHISGWRPFRTQLDDHRGAASRPLGAASSGGLYVLTPSGLPTAVPRHRSPAPPTSFRTCWSSCATFSSSAHCLRRSRNTTSCVKTMT